MSKASHQNEAKDQLDGKSDCHVDERQSAKTLCPDDSKSEDFMEKGIPLKCDDCEYTTKEELLTNYTTSVQSVA